jgi:hypothetical protein
MRDSIRCGAKYGNPPSAGLRVLCRSLSFRSRHLTGEQILAQIEGVL